MVGYSGANHFRYFPSTSNLGSISAVDDHIPDILYRQGSR
jgi:hypothetical protein